MRTIDLALERQQKLISCWIKRCDILSKDVTKKQPEILFSILFFKLIMPLNLQETNGSVMLNLIYSHVSLLCFIFLIP